MGLMPFYEWFHKLVPCKSIPVGLFISTDYSEMRQQPDLVGDVSLCNAALEVQQSVD